MLNRGFTLIEIVIVIAIMALITSIALPSYNSIQSKAKESSLRSFAHSLQVSLESYYLSQGSYPNGQAVHVSDLIGTLSASGAFSQTPKNPFTGKTFSSTDGSGKVLYTLDSGTQSYTLTGYGAGNTGVIFVLQNS